MKRTAMLLLVLIFSVVLTAEAFADSKRLRCFVTEKGQIWVLRNTPRPRLPLRSKPLRVRVWSVEGFKTKIDGPEQQLTFVPVDGSAVTPSTSNPITMTAHFTDTFQTAGTIADKNAIVREIDVIKFSPSAGQDADGIFHTQAFTSTLPSPQIPNGRTDIGAISGTVKVIDCKKLDRFLDGNVDSGQLDYMLDYLKE